MDNFNSPIEYPKPPSLRDLAVRAYISSRGPGGDHKEHAITKEVKEANNVTRDGLIEARSKKFRRDHSDPWVKEKQRLTNWFKDFAPPYGNDGGRIVANAQLDHFKAEAEKRILTLDKLREEFMDQLEEEGKRWISEGGKVAANHKHGWPTRGQMQDKLRVEIDFQQISDNADIRLGGLSGEQRVLYEKEVKACNDERMRTVVRYVSSKVNERVGHVLKKMGPADQGGYVPNPGTKGSTEQNGFQDSLIENCKDLAGLLKHWNFTNDPEVDNVRKKLLTEIATLDPKELKKDPDLRRQAHNSAKDILNRVGRFGQHNS